MFFYFKMSNKDFISNKNKNCCIYQMLIPLFLSPIHEFSLCILEFGPLKMKINIYLIYLLFSIRFIINGYAVIYLISDILKLLIS